LFTWNIKRFKKYFKENSNFDLNNYFNSLGKFLAENKEELKKWKYKKIIEEPQIKDDEIIELFNQVNDKLKCINENEGVGTTKVLHILAPYYFPLLDRNFARELLDMKNNKQSFTPKDYCNWMHKLQNWLKSKSNVIEELEKKFQLSILKLVDEGLYIIISMKKDYIFLI
jgi:hypothetical protein